MKWLLRTYGSVKSFYEKYSTYMDGLVKFVGALVVFLVAIYFTGYNKTVSSPLVAVVLAFLCAFLPADYICVLLAILLTLEFTAVSMEMAVIIAALFLLMLLLFFVFKAQDSILMVLSMTMCLVGVSPMVLPLGLLFSPMETLPVAFGVILYGVIAVVRKDVSSLTSTTLSLEGRINLFLTDLTSSGRILLLLGALSAAFLFITIFRRSRINHAGLLSMVFGDFLFTLLVVVGVVTMKVSISYVAFIIGLVLNFFMTFLMVFVIKRLDFKRCEEVQFEDDEYYYFVKAVPKGLIPVTEKKREVITDEKKAVPSDTVRLKLLHPGNQGGKIDE